MAGFDLHTHTTCSDGTTSPEENVRAALELGLEGLGVTDHDTVAGFERARSAAEGTSLELVLGTEFSAEHEGVSVHLLGLWIDPGYEPLSDELDRLRDERLDRARRTVERFGALGIPVSLERVLQLAGSSPVGRPHVARAVVETGAAADLREVFDTWLADGGPAYVEKHAVDPIRAVQLLVAAGGVVVLAHPGLYGDRSASPGIPEPLVRAMADAGLAGIEVDHPDHDEATRRRYRDLARALGLQVTGGSDYHGPGRAPLGAETTPRPVVERLRGWHPA